MAGQPFMAVFSNGDPVAKEVIENGVADLGRRYRIIWYGILFILM